MGSWRNWLAQESYTFKVGSSSLPLPTMKESISDYYREKDYCSLYSYKYGRGVERYNRIRRVLSNK